MMARLIGIIGSTHGVRFSASPPTRTSSRIASGPRPSKSPRSPDAVFRVADVLEEVVRPEIAAEVRPAEDVEFVEGGVDAGRIRRVSAICRGSEGYADPAADDRRRRRGLALAERDAVEDIRALRRAYGAFGNDPKRPLGDRSPGSEADGVVAGLIAQARRHEDLAASEQKTRRRTARRSRRRVRRRPAAGPRRPV